jgi:predicted nucleic-acid-binding protein
MGDMVILLDTNILLDFLQNRGSNGVYADKIIKLYATRSISGFMAAHSISNVFYILRKDYSIEDRKKMLLNLCNIVDVVGIDKQKIITSLLDVNFTDFEDCLQAECAIRANAQYIITRNIVDFINSAVLAVPPSDFLKIIGT